MSVVLHYAGKEFELAESLGVLEEVANRVQNEYGRLHAILERQDNSAALLDTQNGSAPITVRPWVELPLAAGGTIKIWMFDGINLALTEGPTA